MDKFRTSDAVLEQLVAERRKEVELLQRKQAEQLKNIEASGQAKIKSLLEMMGQENASLAKKLDAIHAESAKKTGTETASLKERLTVHKSLTEAGLSLEQSLEHPGIRGSEFLVASSWITPYYATVHGSNGSIYWQGYNPGNLDVSDWASGSGSGIFGTGAGSFTTYIDWWFTYRPETSRFYGHNIYVPYHGFYILRADDGFWDSKEAHARIDLSARGYQYGYKPQSTTNVFDMDSQNIDVNDRIDGWKTMYYSDLLGGGDQAYLLVTTSQYVYARGGGSYAELNFATGAANYIGVPWVYVS